MRYQQKVTYTIKQQRNLGRSPNETRAPKIVLGIAKQLDKGYQSAPWVRPMDNKALHKDPRDDFPKCVIVGIKEKIKKERAKPMGVRVRVPEV